MARLAAASLAAATLAGCAAGPAPILDRPPDFERGVSLGLFSPPGEVDYPARLSEIRALGATSVSLIVTWVQKDVTASEVHADPDYTAPEPLVRDLIRRAHRLGMRVLLFPILRLVERTASEWRGSIRPADLARWFQSYGAELVRLAAIARDEHAETLSIGSELASTEVAKDEWRALIARVRAAYPGRLLYSANWDHYDRVPFWPLIDELGVSAYWGVAKPGDAPSLEAAAAAWAPIRTRLATFARARGRKVVLTEVGYQSVRGAGAFPWNDFLAGEDGALDDEAQRLLYEAFARAWQDEPALAGVYFWVWFDEGGARDRGYTPRGKPAELVLRTWYRAPERLPPPR